MRCEAQIRPGQVQEVMYLFFSKPRTRSLDRVWMLAALAMEMSGSEFELLVADQLIVNRIMSASPLALRTLSLQMTKLSNSYAQAP